MKGPGSEIGCILRDAKEQGDSDLHTFTLFPPHRLPTLRVVPLSVTCIPLVFRHPALNYGEHENKMCRNFPDVYVYAA